MDLHQVLRGLALSWRARNTAAFPFPPPRRRVTARLRLTYYMTEPYACIGIVFMFCHSRPVIVPLCFRASPSISQPLHRG
jgi:hypothetical protein